MIKTLIREAMHEINNKYKETRKNYCRCMSKDTLLMKRIKTKSQHKIFFQP